MAKRKYPEAIARARRAVEQFEGTPRLLAAQAEAYAAAGQKSEAEQILRELEVLGEEKYVDPVLLAIVHLALDDQEKALDLLERAYEVRSPWLPVMNVDPRADPLRDDPRFNDLLRRVGLSPQPLAG